MRMRWGVGMVVAVLVLSLTSGVSAGVKINAWSGFTGDDKGRLEEMIQAFNALARSEVEVVPSFYRGT